MCGVGGGSLSHLDARFWKAERFMVWTVTRPCKGGGGNFFVYELIGPEMVAV